MVTVLVWAVIGLLVLLMVAVLAVMLTPIHFRMMLSADPKLRFMIHAAPLAGFVPPIELVDSLKRDSEAQADEPVDEAPPKKPARAVRWQSQKVISAIARFVSDLVHSCRIETVHSDLTFGFEDPADTGQVFGLLAPLAYGLKGSAHGGPQIRPDFEKARFEGTASLTLSFVPARLVPSGLAMATAIFGSSR
jgi:hypothetical protein